MRHRTLFDVMSRQLVTVRPETPFKEIVRLLQEDVVSAVPVVDTEGRPVGVVSEADLDRKAAVLPDPQGRDPGRWLDERDRARAEARTAGCPIQRDAADRPSGRTT